ncbi:hypothetical protein FXO38_12365 [Capsicum annuum]|nr:hypothetical protein FXO38_12365 [Capsicum annuum]
MTLEFTPFTKCCTTWASFVTVAESRWRGFPTADANENNASLTKKVGRGSGNEIHAVACEVSDMNYHPLH